MSSLGVETAARKARCVLMGRVPWILPVPVMEKETEARIGACVNKHGVPDSSASDGKEEALTGEKMVLKIVLDFKDIPDASLLGVSADIVPDPITASTFPYLLAVHPSGSCVLYVTQGSNPPALYLCDAHTGTASILPPPPFSLRPNGRPPHRFPSIGLIADRHIDEFLVCTFHHDGDLGKLMVYSAQTRTWTIKVVENPSKCWLDVWGATRVVAHQGELWWADSGLDIKVCNPFDEEPAIRLVEKPVGVRSKVTDNEFELHHHLAVSAGTLRYVVIDDHSQLTMWSRGMNSHGEEWSMTHSLMLARIDKTSNRLQQVLRHEKTRGHLAISGIHPTDRDIVFLSNERWIYMIDLSEEKMIDSKEVGFDIGAQSDLSSKFLTAWILDDAAISRVVKNAVPRMTKLKDRTKGGKKISSCSK